MASDLPCARVDAQGVVIEANTSLRQMMPDLVGSTLSDSFDIDHDFLQSLDTGAAGACGAYRIPTGEPMPVIMQVVCRVQETGASLVTVTDCAPLRKAESVRFNKTPYTVMRVSGDGIIRFANDEGLKALGRDVSEVIGHPLQEFVVAADKSSVASTLAACIRETSPKTLNTQILKPPGSQVEMENAALVFTPDMTLSRQSVGAVVVIEASIIKRVRADIAKIALDPCNKDWRSRLGMILDAIQPAIKFDHAIFGVYAKNLELFKAVAVYPHDDTLWPERWLELEPGFVKKFIDEGEYAIGRISEWVEKHPALLHNEVTKAYTDAKIESSVTLVVNGPDGATSALSLCAKELDRYTMADYNVLHDLNLDPILLRCEDQLRQESVSFAEEIKLIVAKSTDLIQGAQRVVERIRGRLNWDLAAVYQVDRLKKCFHLIAQSPKVDETGKPIELEEDRPFGDGGILDSTLSKNEMRIVNGVGKLGVEQYRYRPRHSSVQSVMTIPISLSGRVGWIFLVESNKMKAFLGPDRTSLEQLKNDLESGLQDRLHSDLNDELMRASERGIVLVGADGVILDRNPAAEQMLALVDTPLGDPTPLWDYAYNDHARSVLKGSVNTLHRRIELIANDGSSRLVLASRSEFHDSFNTFIWFFTDLRKLAWSRDLRFLRETVTEIAQQTRAPISIASTLFRELVKRPTTEGAPTSDGSAEERFLTLCKRLSSELCKADITYERLAEAVSVRQNPMRMCEPVDLMTCVDNIVESLPERDRRVIERSGDDGPFMVQGDEERLSFIIRSILGYLLLTRPIDDTRVHLSLRLQTSSRYEGPVVRIKLSFSKESQALRPGVESAGNSADPLQFVFDSARDDARLAMSTIRAVINAHKGVFVTEPKDIRDGDMSRPVTSFKIQLLSA
ncbi:PAS domain-containing protein [Burkholderia sp. Ac-20365]|uniref:PAS domain-containing protein n=1 Tax=Burkholderia sp. Ac-20365 TaxID=2703897 RepID=UPI00197B3B16|nr:PAS domain-containing protein [Burkholderia sp. Ac-20365]MBN3759303.1 PAS domain-containing protein [Burkholderia sp. Ac-20365]